MSDIYLVSMLIGLIGTVCYIVKLKMDLKKCKYVNKIEETSNIWCLSLLSVFPVINTLYAVIVGITLIHYLFLYITYKIILKGE
jgi:hypothetical protein